ncbi:MAG: hypothetical protein ACXVFK_10930 [Solirubrobacteraceae bacterium]
MTHSPEPDHVQSFVEEVLRTGVLLCDVLGGLLDDLPDDAFPGERPGDVLVEMLVGTVRPAVEAVERRTVVEATALLGAMSDRFIADLRSAMALAERLR